MYKIRILFRRFSPDPPRPFGDLKNPLGHPAGPSGIFQIPSGLGGIWAKIPSTKSEFCTYFFLFVTTNPNITYVFKSKDYQPSTFQLQTVQQTDS